MLRDAPQAARGGIGGARSTVMPACVIAAA